MQRRQRRLPLPLPRPRAAPSSFDPPPIQRWRRLRRQERSARLSNHGNPAVALTPSHLHTRTSRAKCTTDWGKFNLNFARPPSGTTKTHRWKQELEHCKQWNASDVQKKVETRGIWEGIRGVSASYFGGYPPGIRGYPWVSAQKALPQSTANIRKTCIWATLKNRLF